MQLEQLDVCVAVDGEATTTARSPELLMGPNDEFSVGEPFVLDSWSRSPVASARVAANAVCPPRG
ncbi:hypothetical protein C9J85_13380 [Haloferax sp. wsp5]|nr:hypothetical protein C9J85_13380 [Haloferax sp. wsp5]